jgi:beta-galactosidase
VATTPLWGHKGSNFYVVRQADFTSTKNVDYKLNLQISTGDVTIPQLGGQLSLLGRDSKMMVTDYDVGGSRLLYSSADIFTWAKGHTGNTILIMYGALGELHEFAIPKEYGKPVLSVHSSLKTEQKASALVVQWRVTRKRQVVRFAKADLEIRLLWRNDAYNHWVLELPENEPIGNYSFPSKASVIVSGGYLLRTASIHGTDLHLTGDFNTTTNLELVFEPTSRVNNLIVNGKILARSDAKPLTGTITFTEPSLSVPDLATLSWETIDSLPEIQTGYDDGLWIECNHKTSTNNQLAVGTPTSLFASDYGFHTGSLLYRGHFTANGHESSVFLNVSGGSAFSYSVFLGSAFIGSFIGNNSMQLQSQTFPILTSLASGQAYVLTVLIDHMGQTEEPPGTDAIKFPMGILNYSLAGHSDARDISWKMTGNIGGEEYRDKARGPRNEGAMFAERQGYHQPAPPSKGWEVSNPITSGIEGPGVSFFTTTFELQFPHGYDAPLAISFANSSISSECGHYRVQLFVNGYQFGKFISYFAPQFDFPVPEGILNYHGLNTLAITLWALDEQGAKLGGLVLKAAAAVITSMKALSPQPAWTMRKAAY